ncbi:hypothetical protein F511_38484 [Dorcoceras hygrometricum]|uniref:Uncharacterized protein n=1 Tax=Dorcoceras hygrometricum TaxID=472368 RepID=A0A2Z7CC67_9LAMI|nr:hypothetical protein F511_38484 [Dorcoceras hygrometricum]
MPTTDNQGSFLNLISIRRNQVSAMDNDQELEDLELFQKNVADLFSGLFSAAEEPSSAKSGAETTDSPMTARENYIPPPPPPLLSISWFRNLLDAFLCCEAEFKAVLVSGRDPSQFTRPPLDRLIPDLLERSIKALDICNAVTHGVELVRHWQKLGQIAVAALQQNPIGEGQVRRARKATHGSVGVYCFRRQGECERERTWEIGGEIMVFRPPRRRRHPGHVCEPAPPRGGESTGLALPVYIMSTILVFVMWALVAAIPCQERTGLATHLPVPKQLTWAQPLISLQEKIGEDWKKKDKKGNAGLLEEGTENGEAGAVPGRVFGFFRVSNGGGEGCGSGGAGGGAGGDMREDGGRAGAASAASERGVS